MPAERVLVRAAQSEGGNRVKRTIILLSILAASAAAVALFDKYVREFETQFFTEDAVLVIASELHDAILENPEITEAEILSRIKSLQEASVVNLRLDADGSPVDPYGNPFRVVHDKPGGRLTVTCTSAGADGGFGTPDDIRYTHEFS